MHTSASQPQPFDGELYITLASWSTKAKEVSHDEAERKVLERSAMHPGGVLACLMPPDHLPPLIHVTGTTCPKHAFASSVLPCPQVRLTNEEGDAAFTPGKASTFVVKSSELSYVSEVGILQGSGSLPFAELLLVLSPCIGLLWSGFWADHGATKPTDRWPMASASSCR